MGAEVELKLATSKAGLRRTMALPWLKKMAGDKVTRQNLTSVYFDTDDRALRKHGVSLRVRRCGDRRLQTIKATSGSPLERAEWEEEIDRDRPKLELAGRTALGPLLTDKVRQHLRPVFETCVERVVMPLHVGGSEVELAFDEGRVVTLNSTIDIAEMEIELKQGDLTDVAHLARRLAHSIPFTLGSRAKAGWGYALLEDAVDAPMHAEPLAMASSATAADAFVMVGFSCLRQIAGNELAVRHADGEGIHQMRVGLRRLRAALSLFKDMIRGRELDRLKHELKWLTEQLGPVRDYDVFVCGTVVPYRASHSDSGEFEVLQHDLERERSEGFAAARAAVESGRFRRLLLDCALWLLDGEWRNDANPLLRALRERRANAFAQEELARRTRKIAKRVRKLKRLDARERHKLRISVKKLRYARRFFASLDSERRAGKLRRAIDRALKDLQSALGGLNDMQVHAQLARGFARANTATQKAFAIGYLRGSEDARASELLCQALAAGKRLKKAA